MKLDTITAKMKKYRPKEPKKPSEAAVLCLLREENGEAEVILEVRSRRLSHQPGEICFPGGRIEPGESAVDCAFRETEEELGIGRKSVKLIAALDPIYHSSGQKIYPFLASLSQSAELNPSTDEVEEVFTLPLEWFRQHPPKRCTYAMMADADACPVELAEFLPHYRRERPTVIWVWKDKVIWGMTAKIILRLLEIIGETDP